MLGLLLLGFTASVFCVGLCMLINTLQHNDQQVHFGMFDIFEHRER
jgi:hypothetical protein